MGAAHAVTRIALGALALGALALACASPSAEEVGVGRQRQAIVGGEPSGPADDATVMLVHVDPSGPRRLGVCTAALVAPRLVLTARHCVARTDELVGCGSDGTPLAGARVLADHTASDLWVFTGDERPAFAGDEPPALDPSRWSPAGRGLEIVSDGEGTLCDHDLALVLLERPITGVPLASLRLDRGVDAGEELVTVGWGVSSVEDEPARRQRRAGVKVERVGPSDASPVLTRSEVLFDESICLGDSGGPVFSAATGALVAVVSRGGNGLDPGAGPASSTCIGADNLATRIAPFGALVADAFARAGAEPILEPRPADASCSAGPAPSRGGEGMVTLCAAALGAMFGRRRPRRRPTTAKGAE